MGSLFNSPRSTRSALERGHRRSAAIYATQNRGHPVISAPLDDLRFFLL